ncbi:Fc.00g087720.m01.CDS01 [Cosmosporella sp. VM-42]
MSKIYKDSTVTIAAAVAKAHTEGFLVSDDTRRGEPVRYKTFDLQIPIKGANQVGNVTMHCVLESISGDNVDWSSPTQHEPLSTRGWTLQEALLAPRLLMYGHFEVRFHCRTGASKRISRTLYSYDRGVHDHLGVLKTAARAGPPMGAWNSLVSSYTRRHLGFPEDKLRALAGIVEEIRSLTNDTCLFGIWKGHILRGGLAWFAEGKLRRTSRSARAPTWSWASLDCYVRLPYLEHDGLVGSDDDESGWGSSDDDEEDSDSSDEDDESTQTEQQEGEPQARASSPFLSDGGKCLHLSAKLLPRDVVWRRIAGKPTIRNSRDLLAQPSDKQIETFFMRYHIIPTYEILIELAKTGAEHGVYKRVGMVGHYEDINDEWDKVEFGDIRLV